MFNRLIRGAWVGLGSLAIQTVAATVGLVGLAVFATVTSLPWVFAAAGLAVYVGTVLGLVWLVVQKKSTGPRQVWLSATGVLTLLSVVGFSLSVLLPVSDPQSLPNSVAGLQW